MTATRNYILTHFLLAVRFGPALHSCLFILHNALPCFLPTLCSTFALPLLICPSAMTCPALYYPALCPVRSCPANSPISGRSDRKVLRLIYTLRTWQGPQKLFRAFFIFFNFFYFFDFFLIFSIFFARTVYITIQCDRVYIYIWVLASTLAHSASEITKALSVTYKLLFILSKNIVPSRSYRYIRDRAFPVTACHPLYIQSLM